MWGNAAYSKATDIRKRQICLSKLPTVVVYIYLHLTIQLTFYKADAR